MSTILPQKIGCEIPEFIRCLHADLNLEHFVGNLIDSVSKWTEILNMLFRTFVSFYHIFFFRTSPNLECLNLGSCSRINNFDEVAIELSKHCK